MARNHEAERYLDALFAQHKGWVAVAAKNGKAGAWSEHTFRWPDDRSLLLSWAKSNTKGDVFICPALRHTKDGRLKDDGISLGWLWADVDFQDVPADKQTEVNQRIKEMATFTVRSGSGDNVHVYIQLSDGPVPLDRWKVLNTGLRAYLMADAKHTDNALLRLPGTINRKPQGGRVSLGGVGGKVAKPEHLLEREPWAGIAAKVSTGSVGKGVNDGTYDTVDVSGLLRGEIKRRVCMEVDEAVGRYGTRHGAVYQVTSWLSKKGLTADEIHSLMADFPAGIDKEEDERGYSLHVDIARCLAGQPTVESLDVVDDVFEIMDDTEIGDEPDESLLVAARKRMRNMDVERIARQMDAQRTFTPPPDGVSYTWARRLTEPRPEIKYAIDGLAAVGQNVTITGQYKAGKTLLGLNLVKSLIEGDPFLGEFKTGDVRGSARLGVWSMEMSMDDLDGYLDPMGIGIDAGERLAILSGRGHGINLMTDVGKQWAINWLRQWGCNAWLIDSHARLCRMAGVDENDNGAVLGLLHRLDEIKEIAGVGELYYLVHTGRGENGSDGGNGGGLARARGATVIDDWADVRWVLTRQGNVRFLAVEGRSVKDMTARSLTFDEETNGLAMGGLDPVSAKVDGLTALVVSLVTDHPGEYNGRALRMVVRERAAGASVDRFKRAVEDAVSLGALRIVDGPRGEKRYWPAVVIDAEDSETVDRDSGKSGQNGQVSERVINPKSLTDLQIRAEMRVKRKGGGRKSKSNMPD